MKKTIWTYVAVVLFVVCLIKCNGQGLVINSYRYSSGSSTNPCDPTYDTASLTNSLIFYLKLDEVSGNRSDSWTNALTFTDNATVTSNPGVITNAAQFTAANSEYLSRADGSQVSYSGSFSVASWVYLNSTNGSLSIASKAAGAGVREWSIDYRNTENRFRFIVYDNGTTPTVAVSANQTAAGFALNTWYFVAGTFNLTTRAVSIHVNTNAPVSSTLSVGDPIDTASQFQIGAFNATSFFDGRIDEFGFWKRALTTNELAALYNCGNARTCCDPGFTDP